MADQAVAAIERRTWTVKEAARMSGLAPTTVRKLIDAGRMPGRRLGEGRGRILIPRGAFADWLEQYLQGDFKVSA